MVPLRGDSTLTLSDDRLRQIRQACANGLNPELPGVEVDEMAAELLELRGLIRKLDNTRTGTEAEALAIDALLDKVCR